MSIRSIVQTALLLFLSFQLSFTNAMPVQLDRRCLYTGSIRLKHYANNSDIGWMGNIQPQRLYWTANLTEKLPLSLTYQDPDTIFCDQDCGTPMLFIPYSRSEEVVLQDASALPFVGVSGDYIFSPSSTVAPHFVRSNAVPYGPSQNVGNSAPVGTGKSQTFVWKFNPTTSELTGVWTNPDGTVIPTFFYTNPATSIPEIRMSGHSGTNLILRKIVSPSQFL
ncbi:hypothetical protein BKA70DRAFT_1395936 [Coprinopsis sp. MPI-PUGE-AT-0042]|nr:hypothetical protein BKA70DRAFT_1395936 [Coprinopsis sp. MPI-PUGE-AT-0042]